MATMIINNSRFDAVEYIKKLRLANFTQEQAETLAQEAEHLIGAVLDQAKQSIENKELATRNDILLVNGAIRESELRLQKEIKSLEVKLMTLYGGGFLFLLGILAKGFHWW
jgi:hypothetical protein